MAKKRIPKLIVVFDTNPLFTQVASDLVNSDLKRIIRENSSHADLEIEWCLPDVVVGERKFQMIEKANDFMPMLGKVEKLLGHKFGIGADTLELHVDKAINSEIEELSLSVISVDTNKIDWDDIISRSTMRLPPFEKGQKEKGFRDCIIAHSFLQKRESSPATPSFCRLVLVSKDKRLKEYVQEKSKECKNIRLLDDLGELENLVNTIVSVIPEEFAKELSDKSIKLFFEKNKNNTFYYKHSITEKVREQYSDELSLAYADDHHRENGTWYISNPIFIKKDKNIIYWMSKIEPEFEIYKYDQKISTGGPELGLRGGESSTATNPGEGLKGLTILSALANQTKVTAWTGRDRFEVYWNCNLSSAHNLTSPKLEKIVHRGPIFDNNNS